ncbi:MAG: cell division protein FtsA, partial [Hyphomonadaceae bacterium]
MSSLDQRIKAAAREPIVLSPLVAALDIGAAKITCFIARSSQGPGPLKILGVGLQPSRGVRNGVITDLESVEKSIRAAFDQA